MRKKKPERDTVKSAWAALRRAALDLKYEGDSAARVMRQRLALATAAIRFTRATDEEIDKSRLKYLRQQMKGK